MTQHTSEFKVLKFGGTSVGSAERMKQVAQIIMPHKPLVVVLSAVSGTTNTLVEISNLLHKNGKNEARAILNKLKDSYKVYVNSLLVSELKIAEALKVIDAHFEFMESFTLDMFTVHEEKAMLAQGELISTALFQLYLEEQGVNSVLLSSLDFMRINEDGEPRLDYITTELEALINKHKGVDVFVTQGFICRNHFGEIDNLKRGGSDYTASLIGAALQAPEIQIWTDIDGVHNNDPRVVKETRPIKTLSFNEAAELAYFGAKILHPSTIWPAQQKNIPVWLKNTMQPEAFGTVITADVSEGEAKAVAAKDGITAIKVKSGRMLMAYGFLRSLFEVFERYKTPIDMITTSEVAVSLTIDNDTYLQDITKELEKFGTVEVDTEQTIVCIVGNFVSDRPGYAAKVFEALKNIPLRMISYGGSKHNISVLINSNYKKETLEALNKMILSQ
ncbi:MAG: aspartate kinase [Luteibaculaceae bacterium]